MEFRILGPLEISDGRGLIEFGATKERLVLGLLLAEANTVVSVERLADEVWSGEPPDSSLATLRVYVSRLRKALSEPERIQTRAGGYLLNLAEEECDAFRFERLDREGRRHLGDGRPDEAARVLREALSLWRGAALADVRDLPLARAHAVRLEEARLAALEARIEADLALGNHAQLVGELEALVGIHPLREQLWAFRMIALYRSGRQADALRAYQQLRATLAEELGIDPSPALRQLEDQILQQQLPVVEPARSLTATVETSAGASGPSSAQIPPVSEPPDESSPGGIVTLVVSDVGDLDHLEDEEAESILRRHVALVEAAIRQIGSGRMRSLGSGVLSIFGSASDALRMAVSLQQSCGREHRRTGLPRLPLRVALHIGQPLLTETDYSTGAVRVARRLCAAATADEILVSPPVRQLAGHREGFVFRPRPDRPSWEGHEVLELEWPAFQPDAPLPASLVPGQEVFVGRTDELLVLDGCWESVASGLCVAVAVRGDPGIGKSALTARWSAQLHSVGAHVLHGHCDEEEPVPYQPVIEALRQLFASAPPERMARHIGWGGAELVRLVPELGLRLDLSESPPLPGDPDSERFRLFEAVAELLASLAADAPVVLVVDDAQWMDRSTQLLLRHVARRASSDPLLILLTLQDATEPHAGVEALMSDLAREPGVVDIRLRGLGEADVAEWMEQYAGGPLDFDQRRLARELHRAADGNPLYLKEILRHLSDLGVFSARTPEGSEGLSLADIGLPDGVRDVVIRRLDRLSERAAQVLTLASVIGRTFDEQVLQQLAPDVPPDEVFNALDEATRARFITPSPNGALSYSFTHNLVRRVLYETSSATRRAHLHRRVAEVLERRAAAYPDGLAGQLAFHLAAGGGEASAVVEIARRAGDRAMELYAYEEAEDHFRTAIRSLTRPERAAAAEDGQELFDLLLRLGNARWRAGDVTSAVDSYRRAAEVARQAGSAEDLSRAALALCFEGAGFGGLVSQSLQEEQADILDEALAALPDADGALRVRLLAVRAGSVAYTDPMLRARLSEEALAMAERLDDAEATILALLYHLSGSGPNLPIPEQLALADRMFALASALGDQTGMANAEFLRRRCYLWQGDWEAAEAASRRLTVLAERLHSPVQLIRPVLHQGMVALVEGRLADADLLTQRALGMIRGSGTEWHMIACGGQLAFNQFMRGQLDLFRSIEELASGYPQLAPVFHCGLAYSLCLDGEVERAVAMLEDLRQNPVPASDEWWLCLWLLSLTAVEAGHLEACQQLYEVLRPHGDIYVCDGGAWVCMGSMQLALGMLAGSLGQSESALDHLARADERNGRVGGEPFVAWSAYEQARILFSRAAEGDVERADQLLEVARSTSSRLGLARIHQQVASLRSSVDSGAGVPPRGAPMTPGTSAMAGAPAG